MEFSPVQRLIDETSGQLHKLEDVTVENVRHVVAPYRICPLGAHVDHQGGPVLGRTINAYSVLAFWPTTGPEGTASERQLSRPGGFLIRSNWITTSWRLGTICSGSNMGAWSLLSIASWIFRFHRRFAAWRRTEFVGFGRAGLFICSGGGKRSHFEPGRFYRARSPVGE